MLDCEGGPAGPRQGRLGRQHARADGFFASWGWEGALEGGPGLQLGLGDLLIPGPHAMVRGAGVHMILEPLSFHFLIFLFFSFF